MSRGPSDEPDPTIADAMPVAERHDFGKHVRRLAEQLPEGRDAINLCADRYQFLVAFSAVLFRGQTNLLPPNAAKQTIRDIDAEYPGVYCLTDSASGVPGGMDRRQLNLPAGEITGIEKLPFHSLDAYRAAAILFTSGSTGRPRPNPVSWGQLTRGAKSTAAVIDLNPQQQTVLATVPPQHMFGLEMSILLPLITGVRLSRKQPVYPRDIYCALASIAGGRVFVSTPLHLEHCAASGIQWPPCDLILSATAPLDAELAAECEKQFHGPVIEIFGSTETGAIALRRTREESLWQFYPGISGGSDIGGFWVEGGHLEYRTRIGDLLEFHDGCRFKLLGRAADMVKIAGKRGSLGDLNRKLTRIEGVMDGAFLMPEQPEGGSGRLVALVVAPNVQKSTIVSALAKCVDPVFLPRPLLFVDCLPRNALGKVAREDLLRLFQERRGRHEL